MRRVWISDMTSLMVMISFARSSSVLFSSGCADWVRGWVRAVSRRCEEKVLGSPANHNKSSVRVGLGRPTQRTFSSIATLMTFIANASRVFLSRTRLTTANPPVPRVSSTS